MDFQSVLNTFFGLAGTGVLGFVGSIWKEHRQTRLDLDNLRVKVAGEYVTHTQLGEIKETLQRIEDRLNRMVDK